MRSSIDSVVDSPSAGVTGIRRVTRDGRASSAPHGDDSGSGEGLKRQPGWKLNLAGPFDPQAPRGTYLDILV